MINDDKFYAWLDGELTVDEANSMAAIVAQDPALAQRAATHRAFKARLRGAFDPLMAAPVPDRIATAPIDFATARAARETAPPVAPRRLPQWAAMAATLVVGLTVGGLFGLSDEGGQPFKVEGGQLVAAAALDEALDAQLASAGQTGPGPRIGLTYRTSDGSVCRTFSGAGSGLACRSGGEWRVQGLFGGGDAGGGEYRTAAGDDPRLADLVAKTIAGETFDAAQEQAAKARGWR